MTDMQLQDTVTLGWDSNIRDFFITSYAHSLMASPSLWEEIAGYLLNCGHTGRAMLSEVTSARSNVNENANTFSSGWLTLFLCCCGNRSGSVTSLWSLQQKHTKS
jgi:hypothetical protein